MQVIESISSIRAALKHRQFSLALVCTMGNLHDGHLSLVKEAQRLADKVIVSIFVNPLQFGVNEDFASYPRTLAADLAQLEELGVDLVYVPTEADLLGEKTLQTQVTVPGLSDDLCGKTRPGFFTGVATIVMKYFMIIQPDISVFGLKDWQQFTIIQQMVQDLKVPVKLQGLPTVREADGLAMSSRNQYLTVTQRATARLLSQQLHFVAEHYPARNYCDEAIATLTNAGFAVHYFVIRHLDLSLIDDPPANFVVLAAVTIGQTRLIDNVAVRSV